MLRKEFLFLFLKPFFKFILDLLLLVFKFLLEVEKPLINILHLLEFEPFELFLHLFQQLGIFVIQPLSIQNHFLQIEHVLFQR
jgi:hypothetical protein